MAACAVEDSILTSIHCQTTNTMKPTQSSTLENINQRCSCNFQVTSIQVDSTSLLRGRESTKKRTCHRSVTFTSTNELARSPVDDSCSMQAVSENSNNEIPTNRIQSTALLLTNSTTGRQIPLLRTCLSFPSTPSSSWTPFHDDSALSTEFTAIPALTSPPPKRLRPQALTFEPKNLSLQVIPNIAPVSSTSVNFLDSHELADKLNEGLCVTVFDCGSPFRYNENHIQNAKLLRVADRISRKRLKTNPSQHSAIDVDLLNACDYVILYDDHSNNHEQLSPGLKCAQEEVQRHRTAIKQFSVYILNSSFNEFLTQHPEMCESHRPRLLSVHDSSAVSSPVISKADLQNYPMTHIIDGVFIGSESDANNFEELASQKIRYIVNVTSDEPSYGSNRIHYYHIPAQDSQRQNLLDHFDEAYKFIHNAIEHREKVLVHCVAGISRSPAIVISFLMRYAHMNMNDAYQFVKEKRSIVAPNLNFMGQLIQYERKLSEQK